VNRLRKRLERARKQAQIAERKRRRVVQAHRRATREIAAMRSSRTWRIGRMFTRPFSGRSQSDS
jgi:hypothetical protein